MPQLVYLVGFPVSLNQRHLVPCRVKMLNGFGLPSILRGVLLIAQILDKSNVKKREYSIGSYLDCILLLLLTSQRAI